MKSLTLKENMLFAGIAAVPTLVLAILLHYSTNPAAAGELALIYAVAPIASTTARLGLDPFLIINARKSGLVPFFSKFPIISVVISTALCFLSAVVGAVSLGIDVTPLCLAAVGMNLGAICAITAVQRQFLRFAQLVKTLYAFGPPAVLLAAGLDPHEVSLFAPCVSCFLASTTLVAQATCNREREGGLKEVNEYDSIGALSACSAFSVTQAVMQNLIPMLAGTIITTMDIAAANLVQRLLNVVAFAAGHVLTAGRLDYKVIRSPILYFVVMLAAMVPGLADSRIGLLWSALVLATAVVAYHLLALKNISSGNYLRVAILNLAIITVAVLSLLTGQVGLVKAVTLAFAVALFAEAIFDSW